MQDPVRNDTEFDDFVQKALQLDIPYLRNSPPPGLFKTKGIQSSVLMLFRFAPTLELLITQRTHKVETHKGQMAFPGGMSDPEDRDLQKTALRETQEEVGIPENQVQVIGTLPPLHTASSGFWITPFVARIRVKPEEIQLKPNADEIDQAFWIPFKELLAPEIYRQEDFKIGNTLFPIHVFQINEYRIWGATGAMIKNLIERFEILDKGEK